MLQRVVFGVKTSEANAKLLDLNAREVALALPLLALMLFMGVYPAPFLNRIARQRGRNTATCESECDQDACRCRRPETGEGPIDENARTARHIDDCVPDGFGHRCVGAA